MRPYVRLVNKLNLKDFDNFQVRDDFTVLTIDLVSYRIRENTINKNLIVIERRDNLVAPLEFKELVIFSLENMNVINRIRKVLLDSDYRNKHCKGVDAITEAVKLAQEELNDG